MVPMLLDNGLSSLSYSSPSKTTPKLYADVDEASLWEDATSCLANYGTRFEPEIITGSKGIYIYTAKGHRVLDWTSGQAGQPQERFSHLIFLLTAIDELPDWPRSPRGCQSSKLSRSRFGSRLLGKFDTSRDQTRQKINISAPSRT